MVRSVTHGFTFIDPNNNLDPRISETVGAAQSNAAFHLSRGAGISLPDQWHKAYNMGYRIVRAVRTVETEDPADWAKWRAE